MQHYVEALRLILLGKLAEETGILWEVAKTGETDRSVQFTVKPSEAYVSAVGFVYRIGVSHTESVIETIETVVPLAISATQEWQMWLAQGEE